VKMKCTECGRVWNRPSGLATCPKCGSYDAFAYEGKIVNTFVGIMIIIYFAIHIWTVYMSFASYGLLGFFVTLITPIVSQVFWFIMVWGYTHTFFNSYCVGVTAYLATWVVYMCWYLIVKRPFSSS
jgi:hypothetical protein